MLLEEEGLKLPVTFQRTGRPSFNTLQTDDEVLVRALVNRATPTEPRQLWLLSEGDVKSLGLAPAVRARQLWWWVGSVTVVFAFLLGWVVVLRRAGRIQREAAAELKVAVQAARDSERRWKLLFEESPLSVQIFQPDGQTKQFNHAWKQLFRLDEAAGYDFNVLKAPDLIASGAVDHIRKAFEGEVVHVPPVPYVPKIDPSDIRWIGAVLYPLKNETGQVMEVVTIHSDITETKRVEDAMLAMNHTLEQRVNERTTELKLAQTDLIRALEQERELNELKSRFVTTVSHEFRTPLGIIMSAVELMRHYEERLPKEQRRELCDDIHSATRLMAGLMEQVLVLGRVEAGKLGYRPAPIDIDILAGKLTDESLSATNRRCPIHWRPEGSLEGAQADEALLRHIFSNLITNAVKYSPEESAVELTARREGEDAVFQVIDHGIGIPIEDQPRLFEAFHRCSNVGEIPGTGLGLVIVKRCVELHSGTMKIDSEVGRGTTFTVRLPLFMDDDE
jgi:PAS domain S-box-containing protein